MNETKISTDSTARKDDSGKLRYDLIPVYPLEELARVYTIGAQKYNDNNWRKGMAWGRIFRAMLSHAWKFWRGEKFDQEDGQCHLASVAWCAFTLMEYERFALGTDDRVIYRDYPTLKEKSSSSGTLVYKETKYVD